MDLVSGRSSSADGLRICNMSFDYWERAIGRRAKSAGERVFSDFSLEIRRNEIIGLVGPSGVGKTTLLLILAGFLTATAGQITRNADLTNPAMMFQTGGLFGWLTAIENIEFPMRMRRYTRQARRDRAEKLLQKVNLFDQKDRFPGELSHGMKQRVELARAWAADTALVLLDEPLSNLDYPLRCNVQNVLQDLWISEPRTVILVSHDPEEACFLCDRVIIIRRAAGNNACQQADEIMLPFPRPRTAELRYEDCFSRIRKMVACHNI